MAGITQAHNVARWWHKVPGLCWDPALAKSAQIWAKGLAAMRKGDKHVLCTVWERGTRGPGCTSGEGVNEL